MRHRLKQVASAPGRLRLFGEIQRHFNLPVIVSAVSPRASIEAYYRDDDQVIVHSSDFNNEERFSLHDPLLTDSGNSWFKSALYVMECHGFRFSNGIECFIKQNQSSISCISDSSSLIVMLITILSRVSQQSLTLSPEELAEYACEARMLASDDNVDLIDQLSIAVGGIILIDPYPKTRIVKLSARVGPLVLGKVKDTGTTFMNSDSLGIEAKLRMLDQQLQQSHCDLGLRTATIHNMDKFATNLPSDEFAILRAAILDRDITTHAIHALGQTQIDHKLIGSLMNDEEDVLRAHLGLSNPDLDGLIEAALDAGAYGAKSACSKNSCCIVAYAPNDTGLVKKAIEDKGGVAIILSVDDGMSAKLLVEGA